MFGLFKKKRPQPPLVSPIYDLLFGDLPLERWQPADGSSSASPGPWAVFDQVRAALSGKDKRRAQQLLEQLLADPAVETRQHLQAWHVLRELGVQPEAAGAKQVLGVVLEVALEQGNDTLAAYRDHSARLISHSHPATYFDASHDFRNVSDVGPGPFPDGTFAISTHEVAHVVEGASRGVHGSPAFRLWGDSKWAEFYQYDLYVALGETAEAERVLKEFTAKSDNFPRAGTHWFRDWFYPLWRDHGHVEVMANYFRLLSEHYTKRGARYDGDLSWGEYIHFMSGAAGTNLKAQATIAFGWPDEREAEFTAARAEYPDIRY
jgi:hypothetical protein